MKEQIKNVLREAKFTSKAELISKIMDQFSSGTKVIHVPDFTVKHIRENFIDIYKDVSFKILNCYFNMDIPHLIIELESGVAIEGKHQYNLIKNGASYYDYVWICKRAFQKWKYYGIERLKVIYRNDYYDVDL